MSSSHLHKNCRKRKKILPFRHPLLKLSGPAFGTGPFFCPPAFDPPRRRPYLRLRTARAGRPDGRRRSASRRRLQVATLRPEDSGRGIARLPRAMMADARPRRRRRRSRSSASAPRRRARSGPIPRTKGSRSSASTASSAPMPRSARAISSRSARPNRSPRTRVVFAPGAEESAPAGLGRGAEAQLRDEAAHRRRRRRHHRPAAGRRGDMPPELRQMLNAPAFALQEIRLRRRLDRAQGHRPYRREYRGRAAPRICGGQGDAPRRRHL